SGTLPRAPFFMRRHHLEWLWRLILEPKRIKRIWNAVVVFPRFIMMKTRVY
ncbi:MAG: WecB/TagA/CpsF family glycosyltransferase, partial [Patescibacteria group bacterium]